MFKLHHFITSAAVIGMLAATPALADNDRFSDDDQLAPMKTPLVIAHRGAPGYMPEHTLAGYATAIIQGADIIEPDLEMTKDGHLIARHDNILNSTTDVAMHPEFADRLVTKSVDGVTLTGWFSEDFTLAEIKTLRVIERIPNIRPANTRFNGQFEVPTLEEIIALVQSLEESQGRVIGLYPETKHSTHFAKLGLDIDKALVDVLDEAGYKNADDPVFIQSFEVANLKRLNQMTNLPLIQLLWLAGQPYDVEAAGGTLTYDQMGTPAGLADIAAYADGVGPEKYHFIIPKDANGELHIENATSFVADAHALGLQIHPYTFRAENRFQPTNFRSSDQPLEFGDLIAEIQVFLEAGIDGFFTDQSNLGVAGRDAFLATH